MTSYTYDNKSLFRDGKRWFPVMGEIHYSRCPEKYWKESLLKMKEGGVDIVSSYVIWIHHEEIENQFDWTGSRNLRKFVETIGECGLSMILRVGPWSHAEARNGGFPDWLIAKCPKARTNDEAYLKEVEKFYSEIYRQVEGLLLKDGGPIIGLQIENEFGHCGGLTGAEGERHMQILTEMAKKTGFDVPVYTATGWGGAVTAGLLPVMGGYCEAPWDQRITDIEPSGNYVFTYERNDHAIGCDFGLGEGITFDMTKYPYLTAELGGGLQVSHKRRPVARPRDIGGMSLAKMGSGCNLLGYYMYHGGQNPEGKLTTLEENTATGYLNDMSVKNYDFRAPLGEYGACSGTYGEIKLYSLFVKDFGEELCESICDIPSENPIDPKNFSDLRTSWRYNGTSGWVFVGNFQRRNKMADHMGTVLSRTVSGEKIQFPAIDVRDGDFYFLPFNMKVGKGTLVSSLATPLCRLDNEKKAYVFYSAASPAGKAPVSVSSVAPSSEADPSLYDFKKADCNVDVVTLSREDALKAHKVVSGDRQWIVVSDCELWQETSGGVTNVHLVSSESVSFKSYPELDVVPSGFIVDGTEKGFTCYKWTGKMDVAPEVSVSEEKNGWKISVGNWNAADVFLSVDYEGDWARLLGDGKLLDDEFYAGKGCVWNIGLRRYGSEKRDYFLEIDELKKDAPVFIEEWPEISGESVRKLNSVKVSARTEVVFAIR